MTSRRPISNLGSKFDSIYSYVNQYVSASASAATWNVLRQSRAMKLSVERATQTLASCSASRARQSGSPLALGHYTSSARHRRFTAAGCPSRPRQSGSPLARTTAECCNTSVKSIFGLLPRRNEVGVERHFAVLLRAAAAAAAAVVVAIQGRVATDSEAGEGEGEGAAPSPRGSPSIPSSSCSSRSCSSSSCSSSSCSP